jgi:cytochrome c biogenesis protein CcmG/thiol:disulfide interchange protein DsbE
MPIPTNHKIKPLNVNFRNVLFCLASFFLGFAGPHANARDAQLGQQAPAIELKTLDGQSFSLAKEKGKVVILNFWATWCGPCREEMPALDAYYKKHHADGLEMLAISIDVPDDLDKVKQVMKSFSFPAALLNSAGLPAYGRIRQMPQTYVIDRQGILRRDGFIEKGKIDTAILDEAVTPLLNKK